MRPLYNVKMAPANQSRRHDERVEFINKPMRIFIALDSYGKQKALEKLAKEVLKTVEMSKEAFDTALTFSQKRAEAQIGPPFSGHFAKMQHKGMIIVGYLCLFYEITLNRAKQHVDREFHPPSKWFLQPEDRYFDFLHMNGQIKEHDDVFKYLSQTMGNLDGKQFEIEYIYLQACEKAFFFARLSAVYQADKIEFTKCLIDPLRKTVRFAGVVKHVEENINSMLKEVIARKDAIDPLLHETHDALEVFLHWARSKGAIMKMSPRHDKDFEPLLCDIHEKYSDMEKRITNLEEEVMLQLEIAG